jgi:hypothetical protein
MKRDFADRLIANLRSGKFQQTREVLCDGTGHCCLGVAYETAGYKAKLTPFRDRDVWVYYPGSATSILDPDFQKEIGMRSPTGEFRIDAYVSENKLYAVYQSLTALNDGGFTFDQIADVIDYFWDVL